MTHNLRFLCSFLILSAVFRTGSTFYFQSYQLCCQGSYSHWRGQHNYRHPAYGYMNTYRWPESTYQIPHYFFKPPLSYYHYDPCRSYMQKCHVSLFYKCCYDCCNNLKCSVIYNTGYLTTSTTTIRIPTTTQELTTILNTTVEETTIVHTTIPTTVTTEELTTILNTTVEETTIVPPGPLTTEIPSTTDINDGEPGVVSDNGSGDGPEGGSGDGPEDGSGSGTGDNEAPGIQRRHAIMENNDDEDFIFIE